jgi:hypothetical protein
MRTGIAWSCPRLRVLVLAAALAACGGDDDDSGDDSSDDGSDGAGAADAAAADAQPPFDATTTLLVLMSSAFEYGEEIPLRHACAMHGGEDLSPPLAWSGGPEVAGWAIMLTDLSIDDGFVHSVIWDIPGDAASLAEGIENVAEPADPPGSKQTLAFDGVTRGYRGPCPGGEHMYELALIGQETYPLEGVTLDSTSEEVIDVLIPQLRVGTSLIGTFTPPET